VGSPGPALELVWLTARAELRFDRARYDRADVERIVRSFRALLLAATAAPAIAIDELSILDADERTQVLALGRGPIRETSDATLHELFERQAALTPEAIAVRGMTGTLSYRELNEQANRLAHRLRSLGIDRGEVVGLCLDRSTATLVAVLGIMKAGAGYLP